MKILNILQLTSTVDFIIYFILSLFLMDIELKFLTFLTSNTFVSLMNNSSNEFKINSDIIFKCKFKSNLTPHSKITNIYSFFSNFHKK